MKNKRLKISENERGLRLDVALATLLDMPRASVQKAIKSGHVTLNGIPLKASYKLNGSEEIDYSLPEEEGSDLVAYDLPLDILFEDEYLLIVNKPSGLVVHPAYGHKSDTLVNALIAHSAKLSDVNGPYRPGIVHRLDKNTSGLLIVCKNNEVHERIARLLQERKIQREYTALVMGYLAEDAGMIKTYLTRSKTNYQKMENTPATGKLAISRFAVVERFRGYMLMRVNLETGRTHQIRAHMEFLNTPIVGDDLYGKNNTKLYNKGQLLHASHLRFTHPYTQKEVSVTSPLPDYFTKVLTKLRQDL